MTTIIFAIAALYLLEHILFCIGLLRNLKLAPCAADSIKEFPSVALIVAAKNEENNIAQCIESLIKLQYPEDKLEVLVINDNSSDKTGEIIRSYTDKNPQVKYFEPVGNLANLRGKTNALAQAIKKSKGELIFTTDADCIVKPSWLLEMVKYYDDETGIVCGYSVSEPKNLFWGIQSFDWLYLLTLSSGSAGLNNQLSCVGNNMSYRRAAYDEVGGYENMKFSVTEDFMLLQTIKRKTKWKTKFPVNTNTLNDTLPCLTFGELYRQKKRWGRGGLDINWFGYLVGLIGWCTAGVTLFGWLFVGLKLYLIFVFGKLIIDLLFTFPVANRFKSYSLLLYLIPFEIYFALYAFFLPFILVFDRSVIWKNQKL